MILLLFPKLDMGLEKIIFAKEHLTSAVRFVTALRITSKKYLNRNFNAPSVLFALMYDWESNLTGDQRTGIASTVFSKETSHEIKEFFINIYNNNDCLLDFLNGNITDRYFTKLKKTEKTFDQAHSIVNTIINNNMLSVLLKD